MIKQSQYRLAVRRKSALERRTFDLQAWTSALHKDAENEEYKSKIEIAKTDIENLKKKVSSFL